MTRIKIEFGLQQRKPVISALIEQSITTSIEGSAIEAGQRISQGTTNVLGWFSAREPKEIVNFLGEDISAGFSQGHIRASCG
jgi:hypothetical protein